MTDQSDDPIADALAVVLSGRTDRLVEFGLQAEPPEAGLVLRAAREALAALALSEPAQEPSPGLRRRVLRSLGARATARKALLVVDMQNDHLTPGRPLEVPRARGIVPAIEERLAQARADGLPVVYVVDEHEPDDADLDDWGAHNIKGTEGAEVWTPLAPRAGDHVVRKPTYSAFVRSRLADLLSELRVDTLVLTGCLTELQLLATATDALQRGYAVEIPHDSQAGATHATEEVALGLVGLLSPYGPARREILAACATARPGGA
ncbi:MAG TPA: isochorismatase family cysteine hydrolase [Polyangiaceae bacterium]|nr:isochorismatase family cysteine hydrolase [Polyangiaceae bacterium]